jgi:DNA-binding response OmpR family regulator
LPTARILVIDDLPELCDLLSDAFVEAGFAVTTTCDPAAARTLLATGSFDLTLIDAIMPGENGESIAAYAEAVGVRPVLMTGDLGVLTRDDLRWPRLDKPFRLSHAIELVRDILSRPMN